MAIRTGWKKPYLLALSMFVVTAIIGLALTSVSAKPPPKTEPHQFNSPVRIAASSSGNILAVSDINARKVQFLNSNNLTKKSSIDFAGRPSGVAQWKNEVVIANQENGSVCVYSKTGVFSHCLGAGPGEFQQPNDLAIDGSGTLVYVLDTKAKRIMLYDLVSGAATGTHIGVGTLVQPTALALTEITGEVYVSDFGDATTTARVQIFNADGSYNRHIAGGKARFSTPQGLYVDNEGRVLLADALSGEVLIMSPDGEILKTLGGLGVGAEELFYPLDVFLDEKSQDVFVADNRNSRINVFSNGGALP